MNFEEILETSGAGTSSETLLYDELDFNPEEGVNYYRLKKVDFDGSYEYFRTIAVMFSEDNNKLISDVYPNPADNEIKFTTSIDKAYLITI